MSINETLKDTLLLPLRLPKEEEANENVRACSIKPVAWATNNESHGVACMKRSMAMDMHPMSMEPSPFISPIGSFLTS
jgi:hypothetical protein